MSTPTQPLCPCMAEDLLPESHTVSAGITWTAHSCKGVGYRNWPARSPVCGATAATCLHKLVLLQARHAELPPDAHALLPALVSTFQHLHLLASQAAEQQGLANHAAHSTTRLAWNQAAEEQKSKTMQVRPSVCMAGNNCSTPLQTGLRVRGIRTYIDARTVFCASTGTRKVSARILCRAQSARL